MAGVDVWAAHFGLTRTPFTKTIPANKLFDRAAHAEAVARIHYCINEAALGVIVGDTGAGKTVAVRAAVASLDRTKFTLVYLSNPSGGCRGLYVAIATALGATPRFHKAEAINQAAALLAAEEHERHRRVVFVDRRSPSSLARTARRDSDCSPTPSSTRRPRSRRSCSASRPWPPASAKASSPPSISASASATPSAGWTWPSPSPTYATTWPSPDETTRSSPMTPPRAFTATPTGCPAPSTTPPPPPSWPPPPTAKASSTTPAPRKPSPSSPEPDRAHHSARQPGTILGPPALLRVTTQLRRTLLAQTCQTVVTQSCRQHRVIIQALLTESRPSWPDSLAHGSTPPHHEIALSPLRSDGTRAGYVGTPRPLHQRHPPVCGPLKY